LAGSTDASVMCIKAPLFPWYSLPLFDSHPTFSLHFKELAYLFAIPARRCCADLLSSFRYQETDTDVFELCPASSASHDFSHKSIPARPRSCFFTDNVPLLLFFFPFSFSREGTRLHPLRCPDASFLAHASLVPLLISTELKLPPSAVSFCLHFFSLPANDVRWAASPDLPSPFRQKQPPLLILA